MRKKQNRPFVYRGPSLLSRDRYIFQHVKNAKACENLKHKDKKPYPLALPLMEHVQARIANKGRSAYEKRFDIYFSIHCHVLTSLILEVKVPIFGSKNQCLANEQVSQPCWMMWTAINDK